MTRQEWEPVSELNSSGLFGDILNLGHMNDFELFWEVGMDKIFSICINLEHNPENQFQITAFVSKMEGIELPGGRSAPFKKIELAGFVIW